MNGATVLKEGSRTLAMKNIWWGGRAEKQEADRIKKKNASHFEGYFV